MGAPLCPKPLGSWLKVFCHQHHVTKHTIYVSPAIGYASHPVYAQLSKVGPDHWLQAVLQVRVRPGSFKEKAGTLGTKHWSQRVRTDPNFPSLQGLEWLLKRPADAVVVGVLIR